MYVLLYSCVEVLESTVGRNVGADWGGCRTGPPLDPGNEMRHAYA